MDVGADKAPRFGGAKSCKRLLPSVSTCEVGFPGSRRRSEGQCGASPPDQAALRSGVLPEAAAVPGRHRSLCLGASLVAPTASAWPHRSPDAPAYVTPYVKRHKNDAIDAEAICEAVTRPNMRFVATKTREQQSCLTLHRTRHLLIRQQTSVICHPRSSCRVWHRRAGWAQRRRPTARHRRRWRQAATRARPGVCRALGTQLGTLKAQIPQFDRLIMAWHRSSEASRRLDDIPGVGPALATALVATVADPRAFRSGRNFSAWIGLVPKQHSSRGQGPARQYQQTEVTAILRFLFVAGALAVIRYAKIHGTKHRPWLTALLARRHTKVAAIALANKIAGWHGRSSPRASTIRNPSRSRHKRDRAGQPA